MGTVVARLAVRGQTVTAAASYTIAGPAPTLLLGMSAALPDTALTLAEFPGIRYMREFGTPENLTPQRSGKSGLAGAENIVFHNSWKGDPELLKSYMDTATRPFFWTFHHEPMGDLTPVAYRTAAARAAQIAAAHPKKVLCLGNGPILTRYWLHQAGGNPADWWYDGATFVGVDAYNGSTTRYRTAEEMFGATAAFARSKGVPWMVPELGIERISGDSGAGRAQAMRDHIAWIRQQPDCLAVAWWNKGGNRITGVEPEQGVWRQILAGG